MASDINALQALGNLRIKFPQYFQENDFADHNITVAILLKLLEQQCRSQPVEILFSVFSIICGMWDDFESCRPTIKSSSILHHCRYVLLQPAASVPLMEKCHQIVFNISLQNSEKCLLAGCFHCLFQRFETLPVQRQREIILVAFRMTEALNKIPNMDTAVALTQDAVEPLISLSANTDPFISKNAIWCLSFIVTVYGETASGKRKLASSSLVSSSCKILNSSLHDPQLVVHILWIVQRLYARSVVEPSLLMTKQLVESGISVLLSKFLKSIPVKSHTSDVLKRSIFLVTSLLMSLNLPEENEMLDRLKFVLGKDLLPALIDVELCPTLPDNIRVLNNNLLKAMLWGPQQETLLEMIKAVNLTAFLVGNLSFERIPGQELRAVEMLQILFERIPNEFRRMFLKEGGFDAINSVRDVKLSVAHKDHPKKCCVDVIENMKSKHSADCIGDQSRETLEDLRSLCQILKESPEKEAAVIEVVKSVVDKHTDGGVTVHEILKSEVLQTLVDYFSPKVEGTSESETRRQRQELVNSRLTSFAEGCLRDNDDARLLKDWVSKLRETLDYFDGYLMDVLPQPGTSPPELMRVLPTAWAESDPWQKVVDLLKIAEQVNEKVPAVRFELKYQFCVQNLSQVQKVSSQEIGMISRKAVGWRDFVSERLTRRLRDALESKATDETLQCSKSSICFEALPEDFHFSMWSSFVRTYPFLFSFETRRAFLQKMQKLGRSNRSQSQVVTRTVSNTNFLQTAFKVFQEHCASENKDKILQIQFEGEDAETEKTTREFYSILSKELQKPEHELWRHDTPNGRLFPRPCHRLLPSLKIISHKFHLLGCLMAKSLKDGIPLDISVSAEFFKATLLGQKMMFADVSSIDFRISQMVLELKTLKRVHALSNRKTKEVEEEIKEFQKNLLIPAFLQGYEVPGFPEYKLDRKKSNTNKIETYMKDVMEAAIGNGIDIQLRAFYRGFCDILPAEAFFMFCPEEIKALFDDAQPS